MVDCMIDARQRQSESFQSQLKSSRISPLLVGSEKRMLTSKTDRKRKERPLTSYFATTSCAGPTKAAATTSDSGNAKETQSSRSIKESSLVVNTTSSVKGERTTTHQDAAAEPLVSDEAMAKRDRVTSRSADHSATTCCGNEKTKDALADATNLVDSERDETLNKDVLQKDSLNSEATQKRASTDKDPLPSRPYRNILHQLLNRSLRGSQAKVSMPAIPWKIPSWIDLSPGHSSARHLGIKRLAWDDMGVLLAAYCDDRYIRIYDWDMVLAADLKGRNRRMQLLGADKKTAATGCFMIEPVLAFPFTMGLVSFLKWNPFNPDELAVGTS